MAANTIRTIGLGLALAMSSAGSVLAEDFPHYAAVTGVAADDVLNLRAEPTASAPVLGTLSPGATGIEITGASADEKWLRLNVDGRTGWAAARFLKDVPMPPWWTEQVPLACSGTEPFWSLRYAPGLFWFEMAGEAAQNLDVEWSGAPQNGKAETVGMKLSGKGTDGFVVFKGGTCSDGMSDALYAIGLDLFLKTSAGRRALTGCCRLD